MGKHSNKINLISDGFQAVPTSDKPTITPARGNTDEELTANLPVVVTARNLKRAKRFKVLKISLMILMSGAVITALAVIFSSKGAALEDKAIAADKEFSPPVEDKEHRHFSPESLEARNLLSGDEDSMTSQDDDSFNFMNLAKASAEIGMKLYKEEKQKKEGNLLFSPFSIQSALGMVAMGSKSSTMDQLMDFVGGKKAQEELRYIQNLHELKTQLGRALQTIESSANYTIETANSLFVQEDYELLNTLVTDLKDNFGANISITDYTKPEAAAELINTFVAEKTHEKIKNLINANSLDDNTKMVLVNALYFKGMWKEYFDKQQTSKQTFHLTADKSVETDFMFQKEDMKVGRYKERTIVALPYSGDRFVMYLFIPHNIKEESYFDEPEQDNGPEEELSVLENDMVEDSTGITEALDINKFYSRKVELLLPKFKIESTMELKDNLENLGVKDAFSFEKADLSGISGKRDLVLSDAIHKAFIEVNEEGTEAAAATGLMAVARMLGPMPVQAHFNRPFVFFIKDQKTGMILFQGRVADPTQE